jgi:hypothetical protein
MKFKHFLYWSGKLKLPVISLVLILELMFRTSPISTLASIYEIDKVEVQPAFILNAPLPPTNLKATELDNKRVLLSWIRSQGATQYRLYRSLAQGTYTTSDLIFTFLVTSPYDALQYTDNSVESVPVQTYYYVITAVDSSGKESDFSNEVSALPHYNIDWTGTIIPRALLMTWAIQHSYA